jgi:hypothetical protein
MCDFCRDILSDFGIKHLTTSCPLRNSFYCSYCACYGHLTSDCKNKPSIKFREPCYKEQIESDENSKKRTLLEFSELNIEPDTISIKNDNKIIKTYLKENGIEINSLKECRDELEKFAKQQSKCVIYIL